MPELPIKARGDYINGRFVRPRRADGERVSRDPGNRDEVVGAFPIYSAAPTEALAAARAAAGEWSTSSLETRASALRRLLAQLRNHAEDLASLLALETGRPLWDARTEIRTMQAQTDALIRTGLAELAPRSAGPAGSTFLLRPLGVQVVLAAYPQPALLMHGDAVSAIAAGCTVVCKPSPLTPAIGQRFAELFDEADLPRGVFNLVQGGDQCGEVLTSSPECDGIMFSGSERTRAAIGQQLAVRTTQPKPLLQTSVTGLPAALVLDDAHLDLAAYQIVIGGYLSTGQRCTNTRRIIVHQRVADALIERLKALISETIIGHSADSSAFMGPLIDEGISEQYFADVERLTAADAHAHLRGSSESDERSGAYVTPTLLEVSPERMLALTNQEMIGPLLVLARADSLEQGLELVNRSGAHHCMSVFCRSLEQLKTVRQTQRCPICLHNAATTSWPDVLGVHLLRGIGRGRLLPAGSRLTLALAEAQSFDATMLPPGLPRQIAQ